MAKKEKVFEYVVIDDNINIQKLSIKDKIHLLIDKWLHDDTIELQKQMIEVTEELTLRTTLETFLLKSTRKLVEGKEKSVTVRIPSDFRPVLKDALKIREIKDFYDVKLYIPNNNISRDYWIGIKLTVKSE